MKTRRAAAILALLLGAFAAVWLLINATTSYPYGLVAAGLVVLGGFTMWQGIRRLGPPRIMWWVASALCLIGTVVALSAGNMFVDMISIVVSVTLSVVCARHAFRIRRNLFPAIRPERPVVIYNPKSGGGKAVTLDLAEEARKRAITPIALQPGDDLEQVVRQALERGADALAAAGGDGTQAIVAAIAAEVNVPYACIPAGTRNHFALDLGVDRDDVVGALDAFVDGGEKRVDLATVNGKVFVNNVSLGLYAEAVQRRGYRDAKLRTILDAVPDHVGLEAPDDILEWTGPDGSCHSSAAVVLVSNNIYRLGFHLGAGTRPSLDRGELGIAVLRAPAELGADRRWGIPWRQWSSPEFVVGSDQPVPAGLDGEAVMLQPPLEFRSLPRALRVRVPRAHPGVSPSAAQPDHLRDVILGLWRIAAGRDPETRGS